MFSILDIAGSWTLTDSPLDQLLKVASSSGNVSDYSAEIVEAIQVVSVGIIAITILIDVIKWGVSKNESIRVANGHRSTLSVIGWKLILMLIIINFIPLFNLICNFCNDIGMAFS